MYCNARTPEKHSIDDSEHSEHSEQQNSLKKPFHCQSSNLNEINGTCYLDFAMVDDVHLSSDLALPADVVSRRVDM